MGEETNKQTNKQCSHPTSNNHRINSCCCCCCCSACLPSIHPFIHHALLCPSHIYWMLLPFTTHHRHSPACFFTNFVPLRLHSLAVVVVFLLCLLPPPSIHQCVCAMPSSFVPSPPTVFLAQCCASSSFTPLVLRHIHIVFLPLCQFRRCQLSVHPSTESASSPPHTSMPFVNFSQEKSANSKSNRTHATIPFSFPPHT